MENQAMKFKLSKKKHTIKLVIRLRQEADWCLESMVEHWVQQYSLKGQDLAKKNWDTKYKGKLKYHEMIMGKRKANNSYQDQD